MTTPDPKMQIATAIREVIARYAGKNMLDADILRSATNDISRAFAKAGIDDSTGLDDLPDDAAEALVRLRTASREELAGLLHKFADLVEDKSSAPKSLEDLANWFESNLGPVLSRRFGIETEQDRKDRIKEGARSVVDAALAGRGIAPVTSGSQESVAPAGRMSRHRLFWQNFASLAPGLLRMVLSSGGAAASAQQVSALLDALDLPSEVAVSAIPEGAQLDFAASDDPVIAAQLQTILVDAPMIEGWLFSVGGQPV